MKQSRSIMMGVGLVGICVLVMAMIGCSMGGSSIPEDVLQGKVLLLKNNIHYQSQTRGGKTTNKASFANWTDPGKGHGILPVNSQVTIGSWRGGCTITDVKTGTLIYFEINSNTIGMSVGEYLDLITTTTPVSMAGFSNTDMKGIREGKVYKGMSKDAVRIALGYPAPHKTTSLDSNKWMYWKNRFKSFTVEFGANGKVKHIWE